MKTFVTLSLHENYVTVAVRFCKETASDYVEYSFLGNTLVNVIKEPLTVQHLETKVHIHECEKVDVRLPYLRGFIGHFTFTYEVTDVENITTFDVTESRYIHKTRGGRNVSGGFKDKVFGTKIFMNLLNAVADKDVTKLNGIMDALYRIGG